jgi:hypothetical protein
MSEDVESIARQPEAARAETVRRLGADIKKQQEAAMRVRTDLGRTVEAQKEIKRRTFR